MKLVSSFRARSKRSRVYFTFTLIQSFQFSLIDNTITNLHILILSSTKKQDTKGINLNRISFSQLV